MKRTVLIFLAIVCCGITSSAQKQKPWFVRQVNKLGAIIDTMAARGIDTHYIEVPKRPWQVMVRGNANDMDLRSTTTMNQERMAAHDVDGEINIESSFKPNLSTSTGLWVGYRGYGLGYSISLSGNSSRNFTIGATGANYGINLRTRKFTTRETDIHMWGNEEDKPYDEHFQAQTWGDIVVRSTFIDGYYMLNGKRFSYAAAYDQSVKQIRSSGSLMIGAMWFQTSIDYSDPRNAFIVQAMGDIGKVKIHEGAIGAGYSYNWVPVKNLLVNVTAMPLLVFYNRNKAYFYESNYDIFLEKGEVSPTGKKVVPDDDSWLDDVTLEEVGSVVKYGKVSLNIDARFSVTYNWPRFFLNVYGQLNHFRNKIENNSIRLSDWYVNTSFGIRL